MDKRIRHKGVSTLSVLLLLIVGSVGFSLGFKLLTPYNLHGE
jgi:hypothetical protein